jgi:hypothetical protein
VSLQPSAKFSLAPERKTPFLDSATSFSTRFTLPSRLLIRLREDQSLSRDKRFQFACSAYFCHPRNRIPPDAGSVLIRKVLCLTAVATSQLVASQSTGIASPVDWRSLFKSSGLLARDGGDEARKQLFAASEHLSLESTPEATRDLAQVVALFGDSTEISDKAVCMFSFLARVRQDSSTVFSPYIRELIATRKSESQVARHAAIEALAFSGPDASTETISALNQALVTIDRYEQQTAATGLAKFALSNSSALSTVKERLSDQNNDEILRLLLDACGRVGYNDGLTNEYKNVLASKNVSIRSAGLASVQQMGRAGVDKLKRELEFIAAQGTADPTAQTAADLLRRYQ